MRRTNPRLICALAAGTAVFALVAADKPLERPTAMPATKLSGEEIINDVANITANADILVEGVGLVIGLDNTGSDPEPSPYRTKLLDEMRKAGIEKPNELLASKWVALVLVRATIPAGVDPTDRFDVELVPTPASTTTSLAGGYLLVTELSQSMVKKGEVREGQVMAVAHGPVMTGTAAKPDDPRSGRVLEGCRVKRALNYTVHLREDRKSYFAAKLVENTINRRFHGRQGVEQVGMAEAKNDNVIVLRVPSVYHQNQSRFFQVVKLMHLSTEPAQLEPRMARWAQEIKDPATAGPAALRLEGMGPNAIPVLKTALDSPDPNVRFFAAEALAYLHDGSGARVLAEAAATNPDFRMHALAALAAMDMPAGILRLRELMNAPNLEVRYGAFSALRKADPTHHALGRVRLAAPPIDEDAELDGDEAMALRLGPGIATRRRGGPLPEDPFKLFVVDADGPPSIHVSKARVCEIVVFGRGAELLPPVVLGGAGAVQINASEFDKKVEISRIAPSQRDRADMKVVSSPALAAVVRELVQLNATYPEIVALLEQAHVQRNLPGPLVVDALPAATPKYREAQLEGLKVAEETKGARKDGAVGRASTNGTTKKGFEWKWPSFKPAWSVRDWFRPKGENK